MYYRVHVKSISGYEHFNFYGKDDYNLALEVISAHYSYFNEHHPGDLIKCTLVWCEHGCDPVILKDFLNEES